MPSLEIAAKCYMRSLMQNGSLMNMGKRPVVVTLVDQVLDCARRIISVAAATGRAACELWGLCARPPAIEIGEGGLVSLTPGSAR